MFRAIRQIGLGAGLMYFLDRETGRRRRAMLRDRMVGVLHDAEDAVGKGTRDINNRMSGTVASLRGLLAPAAHVPDDVLVARVRARLGRVVSHPHAIAVQAEHGRITLGGMILTPEVPVLLAAVEMVPGVMAVDNQLETHDDAAGIPGLQGEGRQPADNLMQGSWSPTVRLLAGLIGWRATTAGMRRGGLLGLAVGLGGLGLLFRAVTNRTWQRLAGMTRTPQGVTFQKTLTLQAPVREVFDLFCNPENFPRFMAHLVEVRRLDDRRHRWVAKGPAGVPVEWESEITELEPDRIVAWRSVPGSLIDNRGSVRFQGQDDTTRVDIRLSYHPPAGTVGHLVASLFGVDPKHAMDDDLIRLKSLLTVGKTSVAGHTVTRSQTGAKGAETRPPSN
jgi:uncharacterized membrane protein